MIYSVDTIQPIADDVRKQGKIVVLATGFFDLLHREHINFLTKARQAGDVLIVGVESDERARLLKGEGRPVQTQTVRCQQLLDLQMPKDAASTMSESIVNYVISLGADFNNQSAYEDLIARVRPDIYAVSAHTGHLENKRTLTEKYGGQVRVVHEWNPDISTSIILDSRGKQL